MYSFANYLLLALFAAAVFDAANGLRAAPAGPGRLRRALAALWKEEHFLFGGWGAAWREKAGMALFCAGLAAYESIVTFCHSRALQAWEWVPGVLAPVLETTAFLCFSLKILLGTRYNWRQLGVAGALYFIARWVHFNAHNIWWIWVVVAVLAAKDLRLEKPLRVFLCVGTAMMLLVMTLNGMGLLPELEGPPALRDGVVRGTYGYSYPNTLGGLVFGLALAYTLLRARRPRWADPAVLAAAGVFLMVGPSSRTPALGCFLLAAGLVVCRLWGRRPLPRALPWLSAAVLPALAAVSFLLPLGFVKIGPAWDDFAPAWLDTLNDFFSRRLAMNWAAFRALDIKIAGQMLGEWPILDNCYVRTLYELGPVMAVLLAVLAVYALWGYARSRRPVELLCLVVMLLYGLMEAQVYHLTSNPAALLLAGAAFAQPPRRWPGVYEIEEISRK